MSGRPPKRLVLRDGGRLLVVEFDGAEPHEMSAEFLRVHSPSAEVQGHGQAEPQIIGGKEDVVITKIEPVGRYAVRLVFSDGHDSGLYGWDTLQHLGAGRDALWARYLERLEALGMSRDDAENVTPLAALKPKNALRH